MGQIKSNLNEILIGTLLSPMHGANNKSFWRGKNSYLLSPMYGANTFGIRPAELQKLLSPMYGANKNKFYKYSYFSIRYIIKPIIT